MGLDAEVIVVGAGLSGLVCTATLAARGRRVLLLDAEPLASLGGQAHWSFGGLFLVDSPEQRRLGVRDSAELAWADWQAWAGFDRDVDHWPRRWAEAYVDFAAGEQRRWLHELGVRWFPVVQWAERGGNTVPRFHVTWGTGPGLVAPFADQVLASDRVGIRSRHRVHTIEVGQGDVRIEGELLAPSDVERGRPSPHTAVGGFSLRAAAVVVAAGGIGGDLEQVRRNWPGGWGGPPTELICGVPDHVDGSMLAVTERAGGRLINSDRMWHYPEGVVNHDPLWTRHGIRILPGPSSLWLDATGARLPAPLFPGFDALGATRAVTASGHPYSWFVLDRQTLSAEFALSGSEQNTDLTGKSLRRLAGRLGSGPTPEVQAFLDHGVDFLQADSVRELTAKMNALAGPDAPQLDPERLRQSVHARDLQAGSGLGRDPQVVATAAARRFVVDRLMRVAPLHRWLADDPGPEGRAGAGGPLIAVRLHVLTRKTLGGLETDLDARVLRDDGTVLPGVYAAGEAAGFGGGGVHGYRSLEGTFLGGCLFTGRQAARAVDAALG